VVHTVGPDHAASTDFPLPSASDRGAPSHPEPAARPSHPAPQVHEWTTASASTNQRLADLLEAGEAIADWAVVGTDHQTSGRGRLDRTWSVPAGKALTVSVPVRVPAGTPADALGWLPVVTGLAVRAALAEAGVAAQLKWPNDVLVAGRKICGIPVDGGMTVVIGMGINLTLTAEDFAAGGVPGGAATSVLLENGDTDRDRLLAALVAHLRERVERLFLTGAAGVLAAEARDAMVTLGSSVRVHLPGGEQLVGTAVRLDESANLVVRPDGAAGDRDEVAVSAGDVVHVRPA
jgi:BirA family biotin operon repressor/biotin-[acetyl-CoA-carboxylase] ligase